jgi:hypothetical protein
LLAFRKIPILETARKKHRLATIFATVPATPPFRSALKQLGCQRERIDVRKRKRGTRTKSKQANEKQNTAEKSHRRVKGALNPNSFTALDFFYVVRSRQPPITGHQEIQTKHDFILFLI